MAAGGAEFRWITAAAVQSMAGDQLARVALTILVFDATSSAVATAAAYAATFLPAIASSALGHLADRYPRRTVMLVCDMIRAALFAVMAVHAVPIWLVCTLLAAAVVVGGPFTAAATATIADIYTGDQYRAAMRVRQGASQLAQLAGFGVGGVIVAAIGPRPGLAVDAATFAASAVIIRLRVAHRPPVRNNAPAGPDASRDDTAHVTRQRRAAVTLIALLACWIVPEALAAPYAAHHDGGSRAVGVLLCAMPAGFALAALPRWPLIRQATRNPAALATLAGVPLLGFFANPTIPVAAALLAVTGMATVYLPAVAADYIQSSPPARRGGAGGRVSGLGLAAQGVGAILAGFVAQAASAPVAVGVAGAVGMVCAAAVVARRFVPRS